MSTDDAARQLIAEALGASEADITADTTIDTAEAWDSLAHFRVVLGLEQTLGRPLSPPEIFDLNGFQSVVAILDSSAAGQG